MKSRLIILIVILVLFLFTIPAHASEHSKLIKKANTAFHADDCERAVELYNQALEIDHTDYMAWLNLGFSLAELERYDESLKCYEKAVELGAPFRNTTPSKGDSQKLHEKGWVVEDSDPKKAIEYYEKALKENPTSGTILNAIAWVYVGLGKDEKALEYLQRALKIAPLFTPSYGSLGILYYENIDDIGSPEKVILFLSIASKVIDPNSKYADDDLRMIKECKELLNK